jgi:hypothetical protein
MNATECCKTIGCNCAGTTSSEAMQSILNLPLGLLICISIGMSIVVFLIVWGSKEIFGREK